MSQWSAVVHSVAALCQARRSSCWRWRRWWWWPSSFGTNSPNPKMKIERKLTEETIHILHDVTVQKVIVIVNKRQRDLKK